MEKSCGEYVEIIEPAQAREILKEKVKKILSLYQIQENRFPHQIFPVFGNSLIFDLIFVPFRLTHRFPPLSVRLYFSLVAS